MGADEEERNKRRPRLGSSLGGKMARDNDRKRAVVTPMLGAGILGSGAYGSYKLDKYLHGLGFTKGLELNPEAVEALNAYATLRPTDLADPSTFARQYAEAANAASSAQLFKNDPRKVWEWEINSPEFRERAYGDIKKLQARTGKITGRLADWSSRLRSKSFNRTADLLDKISAKISGASGSLSWLYPLEVTRKNQGQQAAMFAAINAHTPEMGQSPLRSYIRLLNELKYGANADAIADNTVEALLHYKNPTFKNFAGKPFNSAAEYFNAIMQGDYKSKVPHLFDKYMASFDYAAKKLGNNSAELTAQVRKMLAPEMFKSVRGLDPYSPFGKKWSGKIIRKEVEKLIGPASEWHWNGETGKISLKKAINPGAKGIRTIQDIVDMTEKSPVLKFLNAQAALDYGNISKGYGNIFNKFRLLQRLRSGKTQLGLGLGALGLGGLSVANFIRNRRKKSFWEKTLGR